ncbi:MAG: hypothetical protein ONB12_10255 [candidate division KSB1 bacterium]|nr:hypothetical protein [candidate division KSB1 bacterium]
MKLLSNTALLLGMLVAALSLQAEERELVLCTVENAAGGVTVVNSEECNPFSEQKCLMLRLEETADLTVQVKTPMGKVVKTIASGRFEAGDHSFYWDGCDGRGRVVKGGVYIYAIDMTPQKREDFAFLP